MTRLVVAGFVAVTLLGCDHDDAREAFDPFAQSARNEAIADTACPKVTAPYFFRIEKDSKTSYLLGTRHIGVAWSKMPPMVHDALDNAKLVVFETVANDGSDETPAPFKPARDELGPKVWKRYRELAGDALADAMQNAAPTTAMIMLMITYEDRLSALEREITLQAKVLDKPMRGLETSAFQHELIDKYTDGRAARRYIEHLDSVDELRQDTIEDLRKFCSGTLEEPGVGPDDRKDMLDSGYTEAEIATMDREMLFDRNHSWIPPLETILADGDAFIVVGADHTRGDQGVPALLTAEGYTVVRVTPPAK